MRPGKTASRRCFRVRAAAARACRGVLPTVLGGVLYPSQYHISYEGGPWGYKGGGFACWGVLASGPSPFDPPLSAGATAWRALSFSSKQERKGAQAQAQIIATNFYLN